MSDEKLQEPVDEPVVEEQKEVSAEELQKALEEKEALIAKLKKESASQDKSVFDLKKRLEKLEEEKLTSEELAAKRMQEEREVLLNGVREAEAKRLGLSDDLAALIGGGSYDEIKARAEMISKFRESLLADKEAQLEELRSKVKVEGMKIPEPKTGEAPKYDMASKMPDFLK